MAIISNILCAVLLYIISSVCAYSQIGSLLSGAAGPGRFLLNLGEPIGGTYPFINVMKTCQSMQASGTPFPIYFQNAGGYPNSSPPSVQVFCSAPKPVEYAGAWIIAWTGQMGTGSGAGGNPGMEFLNGGICNPWTVNSGSSFVVGSGCTLTLTGTNGSVNVTPPSPAANAFVIRFLVKVPSVLNLTALAICRADQVANAAACLAEQATRTSSYCPGFIFPASRFNSDYLCFLKTANARTFRMLAWGGGGTNLDDSAQYRYNNITSAMTYSAGRYFPGMWSGYACAQTTTGSCSGIGAGGANVFNAGNQPDASCTGSGCGYADREQVQVFFVDASASAAATLELGVRGAKSIKTICGTALGTCVSSISANTLRTLTFDTKYDSWLLGGSALNPQVPIPVQSEICNVLHVDCWYQIPYLFLAGPAADMATDVYNTLQAPNRAIFEYSNEPWLTGSQNQWLCNSALIIGLPNTCGTLNAAMVGYMFRLTVGEGVYSVWPSDARSRLIGASTVFLLGSYTQWRDIALLGPNLTFDSSGFYTLGASSASITGGISGTTLTVNSVVSGAVQAGQLITCSGCTADTRILSGSGSSWTVNYSQTIGGSTSMSLTSNVIARNWTAAPNRPLDYDGIISTANYYHGANTAYYPSTSEQTYALTQTGVNITAITNANPGVVTCPSHGYSNGDRVNLGYSTSFVNIQGMTQVAGTWTTVAGVTTNTFQLSSTVSSDGASTVSSDTSAFGVYTSGGACRRQVPGINTELLSAADDYASGTAARTASALSWMQGDVLSGLRLNVNGVPTAPQGFTVDNYVTLSGSFQSAFGALGLQTIWYEGAYDAVTMLTTTSAKLGFDAPGCAGASCYGGNAGKINTLITAYKNSDYLRNSFNLIANAISGNITNASPGQSNDVNNQTGVGDIWALCFSDLYVALNSGCFTSLNGFKNFNAGLPP